MAVANCQPPRSRATGRTIRLRVVDGDGHADDVGVPSGRGAVQPVLIGWRAVGRLFRKRVSRSARAPMSSAQRVSISSSRATWQQRDMRTPMQSATSTDTLWNSSSRRVTWSGPPLGVEDATGGCRLSGGPSWAHHDSDQKYMLSEQRSTKRWTAGLQPESVRSSPDGDPATAYPCIRSVSCSRDNQRSC